MADRRWLLPLFYVFGPILYFLVYWAAEGQSGLERTTSQFKTIWPIYAVLGIALYVVAYKYWTAPRGRTIVVRRVRTR